jgi:hypothetical protein
MRGVWSFEIPGQNSRTCIIESAYVCTRLTFTHWIKEVIGSEDLKLHGRVQWPDPSQNSPCLCKCIILLSADSFLQSMRFSLRPLPQTYVAQNSLCVSTNCPQSLINSCIFLGPAVSSMNSLLGRFSQQASKDP